MSHFPPGFLLVIDGSASAPSISFAGDPDTGFYRIGADNIGLALSGAIELNISTTALSPGASDGLALGTSTLMWADAFFASGAVLNFNNGDMTITHSADRLNVAGGTFQVTGVDGTTIFILSGTTKGFRIATNSSGSFIDGTDQTGAGSYQPINIGGSQVVIGLSGTPTHYFHASGGFSVNTNSDPGAGLIYTNAASFMTRTKTSWTNGAAAAGGTLTNAPAAGNPTKWIPVDDNGTTRYIPAW